MTTIATRPRRPAPPAWTDADNAALAAVLDAPRPAAPPSIAALPPGYAVRLDGTIATLTLPNGGCCAFDGRVLTAKTYGPPSAARALEAAHKAAKDHADYAADPPVVGRRGAIEEKGMV